MKKINGKNLFSRLLSIAVCAALFLAALPVMNIAGASDVERYAYIEFKNTSGKYDYVYLDEDHIYFKNDIGVVKNKDVTGDDWNIKVDAKNRTIYFKNLNSRGIELNPYKNWIKNVVLIGNSRLAGRLKVHLCINNNLEIKTESGMPGSLTIDLIYNGINLKSGAYNYGRHVCGIIVYSDRTNRDENERNLIISNNAIVNININSKYNADTEEGSQLMDVAGIRVINGHLILNSGANVNIKCRADEQCYADSVNGIDTFYRVCMDKNTKLNIDVLEYNGSTSSQVRGILSSGLTVNQIDQLRILTKSYGKPYYRSQDEIVYDNNKTYETQYNYTVRNALLSKDGISQAQLFEIKNKNLDKHSKVNLSGAYSLDRIYDTELYDPDTMYTSNETCREINTESGDKTLYIKPMDYSKQGQIFDSWGVRHGAENITDNSEDSVYKKLYDALNGGAWQGGVYHAPIDRTIDEVDIYQRYKYSVQLSHTDGGGIDLTNGDGSVEENPTEAWVGEKPVTLRAVRAGSDYQFSRWEIYDIRGNKMGETQYIGPQITADLNNPTLTLEYTAQHYEVRAVFELADNEIKYRYVLGDRTPIITNSTSLVKFNSDRYLKTYKKGDELPLPSASEITYAGKIFAGWYDNKNFTGTPITKTNKSWDGDITLYAKFENDANAKYNLTANLKTNDPTFDYYYKCGEISTTGTAAAPDSTVYFTITPDSGYKLKAKENLQISVYYYASGTLANKTSITADYVADGVYKFTMPAKTELDKDTRGRGVIIDITSPFELETYSITYNLNGGKLVASSLPNSYTVLKEDSCYEGDTIVDVSKFLTGKSDPTAIPVTRPGYVWKGWCRTADCSDEPIKYIPAGGTISGDLQLYACWVRTQFGIETKYSTDNGNGENNGVITIGDGTDSAKFAYAGDTVKFTAAVDSGCMFWERSLRITYYDGINTYDVDYTYDDATGEYSFTMPALIKFGSSDPTVKIEATFFQTYMLNLIESNAYTCELDEDSVNYYTLSGELNNVRHGAIFYMTLKLGKGYRTDKDTKVYVNGAEIQPVTTGSHAGQYELIVTKDMTVTVSGVTSIPYDVNLDGYFDIRDLIKLKKIIAGIYNDPEERANADINKDDAIDAQDIAELRKALLEL